MMSEFLGAAKMNRLTDGMSIDFRLSLAGETNTLFMGSKRSGNVS